LPTPEEACNFCLQDWESDSEKDKKVKDKRASAVKAAEEATADTAEQPAECVDDTAEV